jgi:glucose-6-phosphate 1-dehydrogenase
MTLESQMILIFGATGDLTRRKLIPSLYHLERKKLLTLCTPIVCIGRRDLSQQDFIDLLSLQRFIPDGDDEVISTLLGRIEYFRFDTEAGSPEDFSRGINEVRDRYGCTANKLIYLALPTSVFQQTAQLIGVLGSGDGWRRVVFEKPFGENLESARLLNESIHTVLNEEEIYRVDHYLGKELVQNILTLRFANEIFSGAWRHRAIDHVQITVSETLGVEKRAGYYDRSGAVRDMIQNHLLQLVSFVAMEPPQDGEVDGLRNEAVKVMRHLRPLRKEDIVLGQYGEGTIDSEQVPGYLGEDSVPQSSQTETYACIRTYIDTDRWQGVPFYLRTGKRLRRRYADIKIIFKQRRKHLVAQGKPNMIIIRIQPDEGIAMAFNVQKPGDVNETSSVLMDFCHHCYFGPNTPEAYESILHNVMEGDHSLFPRRDWIEASWKYVDLLRSIAAPPVIYQAGTEGPAGADDLLGADGKSWINEETSSQPISPFPVRDNNNKKKS